MNRLHCLYQMFRRTLPFAGSSGAGVSVGMLLLSILTSLRLALGASTDLPLALLMTLCLAAMAVFSLIRIANRVLVLAALWFMAGWTCVQPAVLDLSLNSIGQFELVQLASPTTQFMTTFVIVLASVFPFALGMCALLTHPTFRRESFLAGLGTAFLGLPILLGVSSSVVFLWIGILGTVVAGAIGFLKTSQVRAAASSRSHQVSLSGSFETLCLSILTGFALAIAAFTSRQLLLSSLPVEFGILGCFGLGLACSAYLMNRTNGSSPWSLLGLWGALLVLGYPGLTYLALLETASISNTILLFLSRAGTILLLVFPLGLACGGFRNDAGFSPSRAMTKLLGVSCGFAWGVFSGLSVEAAVMVLLLCASIGVAVTHWFNTQPRTASWFRRGQLATGVLLLVCSVAWMSRLNPAHSEKVLFSGNVFGAFRAGVDWNLLAWLDDGRLMAEESNLQTRWSLWKHRGNQVLVRREGVITELRSSHPEVCPMSPSEVLPGLFPLVAHPAAEHVLILGTHSTTLQTCAAYPLRSVTVLEESSLFAAMESWARSFMTDDAPVRFIQTDIQLGIRARHAQNYDIIVAPQTVSVTTAGTAQLTKEFYAAILEHLAPQGIFSQRLCFYDLGPEKVRELVGTVKSVFPQVLVVESIPGELLLIGTNHADPIITGDMFNRLQLPQTRRVLSELGWDWSLPASRGTLDHAAVTKWFSSDDRPFSIHKTHLAFGLPHEVARWATKSQQTRQELAQRGMALGGYLGEGEESLAVQQRLEDLHLSQTILNNQPDDIWSYRAALKKQLSERPRAKIMQVKHEGLKRRLHPDDQRRKDYLQALGELAKSQNPTAEMVSQLGQFQQPYDPLLGAFVSYEAIHQLRRLDSPTEMDQFNHLLYSIYFSTAMDKSVRNVSEATKLLCEHPELIPDEAERWDQLNGLVEIFRHRWLLRFQDSQRQKTYEIIDTERSLAAIENAVENMEKLSDAAGLSENDRDSRHAVIQETLVRPLRLHRSRQLRQRQIQPGK